MERAVGRKGAIKSFIKERQSSRKTLWKKERVLEKAVCKKEKILERATWKRRKKVPWRRVVWKKEWGTKKGS
jgi:hypothetical protein